MHIILYITASSANWRDHFKDFDDFENISLFSVDGELEFWELHWKTSKPILPDTVTETLNKINFLCLPILKIALQIFGTVSDVASACEISFFLMRLLKLKITQL